VRRQQIAYVADIVAELQRIAVKAECKRLAVILGFALNEARRQRDDVSRRDPPA